MPSVLVVDDSAVDRRLVAGLLAQHPEMEVRFAVDCDDALRQMESELPQLVLTDLVMPNKDGLELVAAVVSSYPLVPVILMTGQGTEDIAVKALQAGAASYVPKRQLPELLLETVTDVLRMARAEQTQMRLLNCMIRNDCSFVLQNDAAMFAPLIHLLHRSVRSVGLCDEASGVRICVALEEALNNALYHGNLEISSQLRETDMECYRRLIEDRRRQPPYRDRRIFVEMKVTRAGGLFVIRDEGPGFLPDELPDPTDPANLERASGRGLLLMRTFMDEVVFNGRGNEVTLIKRRDQLP